MRLSARVLHAYRNQRTTLVFELDVDDIDGWEIPLLVCVAGPGYGPAAIGAVLPYPPLRLELDDACRGFMLVDSSPGHYSTE